ncbi:ABC transporter ATP-binding protein [Microbispora sp. NBC_01189]|uniref:ABC transporter ATP-binding protein n=1 Tax=unclassified Microbispora TaxID=2614687 RepID=UPI002E14EB70|nr:ABC transporter ATP-binding protein [Microbispora sp. NBC_01189]
MKTRSGVPGDARRNGVPGDAVRAVGIGKRFDVGGAPFTALDDIALTIREGRFSTLIGPSGCGKSTLLRILADVVRPTSGTVEVFGRSPEEARRAAEFGFVFQDPVLLPWRTALANVELPLQVAGVAKAERQGRARELLRLVGLEGFEKALPAKLSGGMARRVAIARALILRPRLLFLDEPFNGLDEIRRRQMNDELQRIWMETGTTAILVTHNVSEAVFLSDQVVVLGRDPGRVIADLEIDLPRPRDAETMLLPEFTAYERTLTRLLTQAYEGVEP